MRRSYVEQGTPDWLDNHFFLKSYSDDILEIVAEELLGRWNSFAIRARPPKIEIISMLEAAQVSKMGIEKIVNKTKTKRIILLRKNK